MRGSNRGVVLVAVLVVAAASLAVVPAPAASQENVTLTVTVLDTDGERAGNVDLRASWTGSPPVNETTRANGQALIDVPEGANVDLYVVDDEYVKNEPVTVTDAAGGSVTVNVTRSGSLTVGVRGQTGMVANATVEVTQDGTVIKTAKTGPSGTVSTGQIERALYSVTVSKSQYVTNSTEFLVTGDDGIELQIEPGSRLVRFTVRDDHFTPPKAIANASIAVAGSSVTTLSNGQATLQVPVNDRYTVTVTKDGYQTVTEPLVVREDRTALNLTTNRSPSLSIRADNDRVITGEQVRVTVRNEYNEPVEGATIAVDGDVAGETNAEGIARVSLEGTGNHSLEARHDDLTARTNVAAFQPATDDDATPTATESEPSGFGGPGFTAAGAVVAILALLLVVALVRRR